MNILKTNEGKLLTNGSAYGKIVYLGKNDSADNWYEIDETEIVDNEPEII